MTLRKFGRYEIVNELGEGGMAEVYEARDPVMDRQVALKIIRKKFSQDSRFQERFWSEAKTIANLEHRAIVPVHDFGADEPTGQLYLVMRLLPDVLNKRLVRDRYISLQDTSLILNRLAAALNSAHSKGIMHRDIKPANILLDDEGTVFLADFGLAAAIDKMETGTVPAAYGGSMFYMAPEQWLDEPLGQYTDIYQLGVTLFEMLTGQRPFPDADLQLLHERHVREPIPDVRDLNPLLPPKIQSNLKKAMAKKPQNRYQTVLELAQDVANLLKPKQIKRRYEIKEELQHGRFAIVYQAKDLYEDRRVALKVMKQPLIANQIYRQRFQRQRQQILDLPTHNAVMPVYDVDLHKEKPYIAMKFVEGASLRERFRKERELPIETVCKLAEHLAQGLDTLHEAGQVHGDINLGNVLLDPAGKAVLTDFHITAVAELTQSVLEQTEPLGYMPYLAPEQWEGEPLVPQTDVYQFGVLLYELLAGQRPFAETTMDKLREAIVHGSPPKITAKKPELPDQFDDIFAKALAKQPENRYPRATMLVDQLSDAWQKHSFEALKAEGDGHYEAKQWEKAIQSYKEAMSLQPNNKAVQTALKRAERRKHDSGIFYQSRLAIDNERWNDAAHFLTQASDTPEKKEMLAMVQRKIRAEAQYEAGKVALKRQEWFKAQQLLDETDFLEPNYKDVNLLLGEVAEKIEGLLQEARQAVEQGEADRALRILKPLADQETAVALRTEIATRQAVMTNNQPQSTWYRRRVMGWGSLAVVALVVAAFMLFNGDLNEEQKLNCLKTAVPELHIGQVGNAELVLPQGETATINGEWQELNLSVEWGPDSLSDACHRFFNEDEAITSSWEPINGQIDKKDRWQVIYQPSSSSSYENDRIVVTLSYNDQPLTNVFLLHFAP